jgi:hypothetical protein
MLPTKESARPAMSPGWKRDAEDEEAVEVDTAVAAAAEAVAGEVPPETETESFTME